MSLKLFVFILLLVPQGLIASLEDGCKSALEALFKNSVSKTSAANFLQLQGDLTLHRLTWAYLQAHKSDPDSSIKPVEETILELLNEKYTNSNPDFIKAREAFEAQPLSRTTLSEIAPYLVDIVSHQFGEEASPYKLNLSDVKLLSALAKFEKKSAKNGKFDHRLLSSKTPLGMLNFIKLINSSYKTELTNEEEALQVEKKITGLENIILSMEKKLSDFLNSLSVPGECTEHSQCSGDNNCNSPKTLSALFNESKDIQNIFWESLSDKLFSDDILLEKLTYGTLWVKVRESFVSSVKDDVKKVITNTTPTPQMKSPSPYIAKDLGVLIEDPIGIILKDGIGRKRVDWEKHSKDFQLAMAESILSGDKVFDFNGHLFNRQTGKMIDLHQAISVFPPLEQERLKKLIQETPEGLRLSIVKTIVNGDKSFIYNNKLYNSVGKEISNPTFIIAEEMSKKLGRKIEPKWYENHDTSYLIQRANALKNNKPYFKFGGKTFDTFSGKNLLSPSRIPTTSDVKIDKSKSTVYQHLSDSETIRNYHREKPNPDCNYYGILDKKNALFKIFANNGQEVYSTEALVGSRFSDSRTRWTEYRSPVDKTASHTTGAGIYTVIPGNPKDEYNRTHFNNNLISFHDEKKNTSVFAIHQVPNNLKERYLKFGTSDPADRRVTGGCANLKSEDIKRAMTFLGPKCKFYVLPEEPDNKFIVKDGLIKFVSTKQVSTNSNLYNYSTSPTYPMDIKINITNKNVNNLVTQTFTKALEDEKKKIMEIYKISNEEYNELALVAFGILGNESSFGKSPRLYFKEEHQHLVILAKILKGEDVSVASNTSRGPTQIKFMPEDILKKHYPEIDKANLMNPRNAAIATMAYLADAIRQIRRIAKENKLDPEKLRITKENMMDYITYLYQGRRGALTSDDETKQATPLANEYYRNLQKNMSYIEIRQKIE
jgi:hypothetical protein